jgi:hypothetical protein
MFGRWVRGLQAFMRIKQYHKEGQALRTETTTHQRPATAVPELRSIGFATNRRMRQRHEQISHDCALGEDAFQDLQRPLLRPGLALVSPQAPAASPASLQRSFRTAEQAVNTWCDEAKIAA